MACSSIGQDIPLSREEEEFDSPTRYQFMKSLMYEVIVPTIYGDTMKPIRTKHHKEWDKRVMKITGGLTILSTAKGKWVHDGIEYPERVIPVRIMCSAKQAEEIGRMTLEHYRQKAVLYYKVSDEAHMIYADNTGVV